MSRTSARWLPLLVGMAAMAMILAAGCSPEPASCAMCGRHECGNMVFTVVRDDGVEIPTCCARCGAHAISQEKLQVASVRVRDFDTAKEIDATKAVFVEGSDVHPCRGVNTETPRDPHGCCLQPKFDRCEPSVLAFRDESSARAFVARHGGTLTTWSEIGPGEPASSPG